MEDQKTLLRRKLLEALRSGKYEQCQGVLYEDGNRYCVYGLAEKIAKDTGILPEGAENPGDIPRLFGFREELQHSVWQHNDGVDGREHYDFLTLANYLENEVFD